MEIGANSHKRLISFLDRAGPVSLNTVSRRQEFKEIAKQNAAIQHKINHAKSDYSLTVLKKHCDKRDHHRKILADKGPSFTKMDPLINLDRRLDVSTLHYDLQLV